MFFTVISYPYYLLFFAEDGSLSFLASHSLRKVRLIDSIWPSNHIRITKWNITFYSWKSKRFFYSPSQYWFPFLSVVIFRLRSHWVCDTFDREADKLVCANLIKKSVRIDAEFWTESIYGIFIEFCARNEQKSVIWRICFHVCSTQTTPPHAVTCIARSEKCMFCIPSCDGYAPLFLSRVTDGREKKNSSYNRRYTFLFPPKRREEEHR